MRYETRRVLRVILRTRVTRAICASCCLFFFIHDSLQYHCTCLLKTLLPKNECMTQTMCFHVQVNAPLCARFPFNRTSSRCFAFPIERPGRW